MPKELKENMDKELQEIKKVMYEQDKNIIKREILKRNQMKILALKNTITKVKSLMEKFKSSQEQE